MRNRKPVRFSTLILSASLLIQAASADVRTDLEPFLEQHCYDCHDDFDHEGDLNLLDLKFDPSDPRNLAIWKDVFVRVEDGEMPPKKKKRPEAGAMATFLKSLEKPLMDAELEDLKINGRVHSRRLTREEYEYSMHDLLGIGIPLGDYLTAEASEGFDNKADTQQLSHFHLNGYLRAAAAALDEAFARASGGEEKFKKVYSPGILASTRGRGNPRGPQFIEGKAVAWRASVQFYGRMTATEVPKDGWYRITVKDVEAINPGPDGVVWGTLQTGYGHSDDPLLTDIGKIEATADPQTKTFLAWMKAEDILLLRPVEGGRKIARVNRGGTVQYQGWKLRKEGYDGISFKGINIERVYPKGKREVIRKNLFDDLAKKNIQRDIEKPQKELRRLIQRFASIAWRRPVKVDELTPYFALANAKLKDTGLFPSALKAAYHAVLTSPRFLTLIERPGKLDDHALASRLSYFLWKSSPDWRLRKLAREGTLSDPAVLRAETNRLLAHQKSKRFIQSFTDQWLELREIDFTQPDPRRFRSFDPALQSSMVEETQAFITELVKKDLSVKNFLKSDFAFLNTRLKNHYNLENLWVKHGSGLQKVKLKPGQRSGLLTQGSILKVTADGSATSPILRGVWINERILGHHIPPPPPNIPAVEPDIRGAVSIRDQLAKHSTQTSCASCHVKIDPPGFALESYDPIGNYRTTYGAKKSSAKVDPSGETTDGAAFDDYEGWRNIYLERPEVLARAFAKQVLEFSTGGEIRFGDREVLDRIVTAAEKKDHGLKSIIQACVSSPIFQTK